jgi:hypothetical protein
MNRAGAALRNAAAIFGAGSPMVSRIAQSSGMSGSTSISTVRPLMLSFAIVLPPALRDPARQCR